MGISDAIGEHVGSFWALEIASLAWFPALLAFFWAVEKMRPFVEQGARPNATDVKYWLLNPVLEMVTRATSAFVMLSLGALIGVRAKLGIWHGFGPVMNQPRWLIFVEMIFLLELTAYWSHRLCHTVPWLWRFHAVHHSARRLNWLSAGRFHPVNQLFTRVSNMLPLFCLGFPVDDAMKLFPFVAFSALLAHANLNLRFGPLSALLVGPVYHRFHHTLSREGGNKNFAGFCPVFDIVFGTFYLPPEDPGALGVDGEDVPDDVFGQLVHPFAPDAESAAADEVHPAAALPSRPSW
jgi:sterol desaturase/sphingolipid hydroxylase (fatty acid hydroxylase superfamily)